MDVIYKRHCVSNHGQFDCFSTCSNQQYSKLQNFVFLVLLWWFPSQPTIWNRFFCYGVIIETENNETCRVNYYEISAETFHMCFFLFYYTCIHFSDKFTLKPAYQSELWTTDTGKSTSVMITKASTSFGDEPISHQLGIKWSSLGIEMVADKITFL